MTEITFQKDVADEKIFLDYITRVSDISQEVYEISYDRTLMLVKMTLKPDATQSTILLLQEIVEAFSNNWLPPPEYVYESKPLRRQLIDGVNFAISCALTFNGLRDDPNFAGLAVTSCSTAPYTVRIVDTSNRIVLMSIEKQNTQDEKTILLIDKSNLPINTSEFEVHIKPTTGKVMLHGVQVIREI